MAERTKSKDKSKSKSSEETTVTTEQENIEIDAAETEEPKLFAPTTFKTSKKKQQTEMHIPLSDFQYPAEVSIKTLLEAGAHFGHQTDKWNPKMAQYIYTAKNGIHIINLDQTLEQFKKARQYVADVVSAGGNILFVGTKLQARELVEHEAHRCGGHFVTSRWLGGTLSNFQTIKNSIERMRKLEDLVSQSEKEGTKLKLTKKERLEISREVEKLEASLGGIRQMRRVPEVLFVVDVVKEQIAIAEARRLRIPVIALVDTNADPECVQFPIPSNDDAARTIRLFLAAIADTAIDARAVYEARMAQSGQNRNSGKGDAESKSGSEERHAAESSGSTENASSMF